MKHAPTLLAVLGLALVLGILILRPRPVVPPGPSVLPEFDSAAFMPIIGGVCPVVNLEGADAQALRPIFEGRPMEREIKEWREMGELTLLRDGREVLEIGIFASSGGLARFAISGGHCHSGYDQAAFRQLLKANGWASTPSGWQQVPAR